MNEKASRSGFSSQPFYSAVAILCAGLLAPGYSLLWAQQAPEVQSQEMTTTEEAPPIPNDQLDSLVAPIALYPDSLLAQTLAASTYPLELIQLQQWMERNKNLKDQALVDAVEKQNWDPSIQAMAAFPDVVQRLAGNIQWTTDLGNAFLAQQGDVMDAVQRMRTKAQGTGNLKTGAQQKVETQTIEGGKQVIMIQQANPKVVYVPSYDPVVVYGAPSYPYYPYHYPGYVAGMGVAFGTGLALGAAWGGNWGWGCGWGRGNVTINYNNKYVNNSNKNWNKNQANINRPSQLPAGGGNRWQHNPQHRGNAPYPNRGTADRVGARNPSQLPERGAGNRPGGGAGAGNITGGDRPGGGSGIGNRPGGGAGISNRPGGGAGNISGGDRVGNRPGGGAGIGNRPSQLPAGGGAGAGADNRPGGGAGVGGGAGAGNIGGNRPSGSNRPSTLPAGGGGDRIGNRGVSSGAGAGARGGAFSGGGGSNGNAARAASNRGAQSMGGGGLGGRGGGGGRRR